MSKVVIKYLYKANKLLNKSCDNTFIVYRYVQAREMIYKCLNLAKVIQYVIVFLYFTLEELMVQRVVLDLVLIMNWYDQLASSRFRVK